MKSFLFDYIPFENFKTAFFCFSRLARKAMERIRIISIIPNISNETQTNGLSENNLNILKQKAEIAEAWQRELVSANLVNEQITMLILASGPYKKEFLPVNYQTDDTRSILIPRMLKSIFFTNFLNWTERLYEIYSHSTDYIDYIDEYRIDDSEISEIIEESKRQQAKENSCSLKFVHWSNQTIGFCVGSCLNEKVDERNPENLIKSLKPKVLQSCAYSSFQMIKFKNKNVISAKSCFCM